MKQQDDDTLDQLLSKIKHYVDTAPAVQKDDGKSVVIVVAGNNYGDIHISQ